MPLKINEDIPCESTKKLQNTYKLSKEEVICPGMKAIFLLENRFDERTNDFYIFYKK